MEQATEDSVDENSTISKNNAEKITKVRENSAPKNVLDGSKVKRHKEKASKKLKEKHSNKLKAHIPFHKNFAKESNTLSNAKEESSSKNNSVENLEKMPKLNKKVNDLKSPEIVKNTTNVVSPKVNVFQFMMNSRSKVIGRNSPGKDKKPEIQKKPEELLAKKEKLSKIKGSFEEWAEKKGGQKRKLANEAQDKYIKKTMRKRAKRLKKMLDIIDEDLRNSSHDEVENDDEIFNKKSKNKICVKSESKNSNDSTDLKQSKFDKNNFNSKDLKNEQTAKIEVNKHDNLKDKENKKLKKKNTISCDELHSNQDEAKIENDKQDDINDKKSKKSNTNNTKSKKETLKTRSKKKLRRRLVLSEAENSNNGTITNNEQKNTLNQKEFLKNNGKIFKNQIDTESNKSKTKDNGNKSEIYQIISEKTVDRVEIAINETDLNMKSDKNNTENQNDVTFKDKLVNKFIEINETEVNVQAKSTKKKNTLFRSLSLKKVKGSNSSKPSDQNIENSKLLNNIDIEDDDSEDIFPLKNTKPKSPSITHKRTCQVNLFNDSITKKVEEEKKIKDLNNSESSDQNTEKSKILNNIDLEVDNSEDIFPLKNTEPKTPTSIQKRTRQLKLFNELPKKVEADKAFSPRSWKMKVRIFEKENVKEENTTEEEEVIVIEDDSSKTSLKQGETLNCFSPTNLTVSCTNVKKQVKLAPLFLRQPKKSSKADVEAKKNFLNSGMPDQVKKIAVKQQNVQEICFEIFPKISHVQQRASDDEFSTIYWDLPSTSLVLIENILDNNIELLYNTMNIGTFTNCKSITSIQENVKKQVHTPERKLPNLPELIKETKNEYPYYPIFKTFRLLYQKYLKQITEAGNKIELTQLESTSKSPEKQKRRGRPKKNKKTPNKKNAEMIEIETSSQIDTINFDSQIWTEKYKPQCQDDIIGNFSTVKELKSWLELWVAYSLVQKTTKKRKRSNSNSSDDFCSDSDTRDTDILPQNMIILIGPYGCGKTASVYALCNELNINIIEINASSKRTGKRILTELLEATQSHQVNNTDGKSINSFFQKKTDTTTKEQNDDENKKLSLLLMEDVDIVFDDQDDGFISSLATLVTSSKRPIILTTSDENCLHLQKLISQYQVLHFNSLSARVTSPWLQVLCLIEGIKADKYSIDQLLHWNKGDIRKTILQLQFWVQTGGDSSLQSSEIEPYDELTLAKQFSYDKTNSLEEEHVSETDESSNLSWFESANSNQQKFNTIHKNCVTCFIPYYERDKIGFQLLFPINLGVIWWNISSVLKIQSVSHTKIDKINNEKETNTSNQSNAENSNNDTTSICSEHPNSQSLSTDNKTLVSDLKTAANLLESFIFTDTMYTKLKIECDTEPTCNYWQSNPTNSLTLTENFEMYNESNNISLEISHWLVENTVNQCKKIHKTENQKGFDINDSLPNIDEIRWRTKNHKSMQDMSIVIPAYSILDRSACCKDYFSILRTICRVENNRLTNNNKRKNRFYHYFKTFNIHLSESTYLTLCNSLATND